MPNTSKLIAEYQRKVADLDVQLPTQDERVKYYRFHKDDLKARIAIAERDGTWKLRQAYFQFIKDLEDYA